PTADDLAARPLGPLRLMEDEAAVGVPPGVPVRGAQGPPPIAGCEVLEPHDRQKLEGEPARMGPRGDRDDRAIVFLLRNAVMEGLDGGGRRILRAPEDRKDDPRRAESRDLRDVLVRDRRIVRMAEEPERDRSEKPVFADPIVHGWSLGAPARAAERGDDSKKYDAKVRFQRDARASPAR